METTQDIINYLLGILFDAYPDEVTKWIEELGYVYNEDIHDYLQENRNE